MAVARSQKKGPVDHSQTTFPRPIRITSPPFNQG